MSETRNLFHLQCAGKMARASTDLQIEWLQGKDLNSTETLIALERKFFLGRKTALALINSIEA